MISINLLPPELKMRRLAAKKNASLVSVCLVIILIVIIVAVIGQSFKNTVIDNYNKAESDVTKNTSQADESKDLQNLAFTINDRAQATDQINAKRAVWSQILLELANDTPTDIQFESVNCSSEKSPNFTLQGNAASEREIIKFKEKLESSSIFKNVNFKSSTRAKSSDPSVPSKLSFSLDFDLEILGSSTSSK